MGSEKKFVVQDAIDYDWKRKLGALSSSLEVWGAEVSDGFHTMSELYDHRLALNVALFNFAFIVDMSIRGEAAANAASYIIKSRLHNDGTMFEGGYFVVVMNGPDGQISYHYKLEHWDKFKIPEMGRIPWPYDGHTPNDCIERLLKI